MENPLFPGLPMYATDVPLYVGLLLLGAAYFMRTYVRENGKILKRTKYVPELRKWQGAAAVGWVIVGLSSGLHAMQFLATKPPDYVNAVVFSLALPLCFFIGYHEWLSMKYKQELKTLRFLNGVVFLFMLPATVADRVPIINAAIVTSFAWQAAMLLTIFGYDTSISGVDPSESTRMWYRENDNFISVTLEHTSGGELFNEIDIIVSCTALPSMLLFAAAVACSSAPFREKMRTGLLVVGLVHVLNVVRVSLFTFLIYEGHIDDLIAHAVVGKVGSIVILLLLVMLLFKRIPDIRESIGKLFILHHRAPPEREVEKPDEQGNIPVEQKETVDQPPAQRNADVSSGENVDIPISSPANPEKD